MIVHNSHPNPNPNPTPTPTLTLTPTLTPTLTRYNRPGYLQSNARRIADAVASLPEAIRDEAHILYSAQGLPRAYIKNMGDPYEEQVRHTP